MTLVGLICGGSLLLLGRGGRPPLQLAGRGRAVAVWGMVLVAAFAAVALVGNSALKASDSARREGDWNRAASEARLARRWLPWSSQPLLALGEAELGAGRIANARATFRKGISMDGKNWRLWYDLAQASRGRARALALRHVVALYPRSGLVAANTVKSRKRGRAP